MGSAVVVLFFLMGEAHLEEGRALRQLVGLKSCPHSVPAQSACCRKAALKTASPSIFIFVNFLYK